MAIIYALLEPGTEKPRYIGSTADSVSHRVKLHWVSRFKRKTNVAIWLQSLNNKPDCWIIQEVSNDLRWQAEEYWTDLLRQMPDVMLLNQVSGRHSVGSAGRMWTDEQRKQQSLRTKAAWMQGTLNPVRGENRSDAKLTADAVREIRLSSENAPVLAQKFNVSPRTIHAVRRKNGSWKHVV